MKIVDFHTHVVPSQYPDRPQSIAEPNWPSMEKIDDRNSRMVIAGKQFRVFQSFYWNADERIQRLDEVGVAVQVISPLPELLSYWLSADAAEVLTDFMNHFIAELVGKAPDRFVGMGAVALQDPPRAVRQLEQLKSLGLRGVHVGSHVNGKSIADPMFYPFYEAAEALDLAIFVHGIKPGGVDLMLGSPLMPATIGVPHETTMAIASLMMTDILGRFPKLKLVFSHGGGTLASVIDRFNAVWSGFDAMRTQLKIPPIEYARRFYYDTVVFAPDYLAFLVRKFGASQLVAGTDGPVDFGQPPILGFLADAGLQGADREQVAHGNAERLLNL
jgi:aminocarboxymuconate-semialdehyde decarboxylase